MKAIRLGVNLDHVATLRQARGTSYPDPVAAALSASKGGADSITLHLREDRRHIQPHDVRRFQQAGVLPLNLEMAATQEMIAFACEVKPRDACLVPERRAELTTEGGLDVVGHRDHLVLACSALRQAGIKVSLFVDPDPGQLDAILATGVPAVEIHTGRYADTEGDERQKALTAIVEFAHLADQAGLQVHAGHGLTLENVAPVAGISEVVELNIGHSLVARSVFVGIEDAVAEMRRAMSAARAV